LLLLNSTSAPIAAPVANFKNPSNSSGIVAAAKEPKLLFAHVTCKRIDLWLGDQDSNLDKVRQRHLTYR
jgi:hypothetical protein